MKIFYWWVFAFTTQAALAASAAATVISLDFEGIGSQATINNFYNGGNDSQGNNDAYRAGNSSTDIAMRKLSLFL